MQNELTINQAEPARPHALGPEVVIQSNEDIFCMSSKTRHLPSISTIVGMDPMRETDEERVHSCFFE